LYTKGIFRPVEKDQHGRSELRLFKEDLMMEHKPLSPRWKVLQVLTLISLLPPAGIFGWFLYRIVFGGAAEAPAGQALAIFLVPPLVLIGLFAASLAAFERGRMRLGQTLTVLSLLLSLFATIFYVVLLRAMQAFS